MITQLLLGSTLICLILVIEVMFIGIASAVPAKSGSFLGAGRSAVKFVLSLLAVVLWILLAIGTGVWIWAAAFLLPGQFQHLEEALHFAVVSMTTLGHGDIALFEDWRLFSRLIAANGLILFSLATAFFIEFIGQLRAVQVRKIELRAER